jgi:hypothetical protein
MADAQTLRLGVPLDGVKLYNLSQTLGQEHVDNCLFNYTTYDFELYARASSQSWAAEQHSNASNVSSSMGSISLEFGHYLQNITGWTVPRFEPYQPDSDEPSAPPSPASSSSPSLGRLELTTEWQRLRVRLPPAERPCRVFRTGDGSSFLYGIGISWQHHLSIVIHGGAGPQSVWIDDVKLLANASSTSTKPSSSSALSF